jgi:hypothetical protein
MKWNVFISEVEPEATSVHEPQELGEKSRGSRSETALPAVDSIIEQVRRDASTDAVKYLLRSDVSHDGE